MADENNRTVSAGDRRPHCGRVVGDCVEMVLRRYDLETIGQETRNDLTITRSIGPKPVGEDDIVFGLLGHVAAPHQLACRADCRHLRNTESGALAHRNGRIVTEVRFGGKRPRASAVTLPCYAGSQRLSRVLTGATRSDAEPGRTADRLSVWETSVKGAIRG